MTMNRRTVRTMIVTAILVVLLAGVVGELTFGSRGHLGSAQAETVTITGRSQADDLDLPGNISAAPDSSTVVAVGGEGALESGFDVPVRDTSVSAESGSAARSASNLSEGGTPMQPVATTNVAVIEGGSVEPADSGIAEDPSTDDDAHDSRQHFVDDHAVEHSAQHSADEAQAHGRDEEAHLNHQR